MALDEGGTPDRTLQSTVYMCIVLEWGKGREGEGRGGEGEGEGTYISGFSILLRKY